MLFNKFKVLIKLLTKKIKGGYFHNSCYEDMKLCGMANFGECCGSLINSGYLSCDCVDCPYLKKE